MSCKHCVQATENRNSDYVGYQKPEWPDVRKSFVNISEIFHSNLRCMLSSLSCPSQSYRSSLFPHPKCRLRCFVLGW